MVIDQVAEKREILLRIWDSLRGLEPQVDFVIDSRGRRELVLSVDERVLQTLSRVNGTRNIDLHERVLIDYALHQIKPARRATYYERSYDPATRAIFDCYNRILESIGA